MTIDEAIQHAEKVINEKRDEACNLYEAEKFEEAKKCIWCVEEHMQLAECLKELKLLREKNQILEKASKLDDCITNLNYITESLVVLRDIYNSGDCNSCIDKNNCMYCPEPGRLVRYNCPFYHEKGVNKDGSNT